jgi:hypothetical protein
MKQEVPGVPAGYILNEINRLKVYKFIQYLYKLNNPKTERIQGGCARTFIQTSIVGKYFFFVLSSRSLNSLMNFCLHLSTEGSLLLKT